MSKKHIIITTSVAAVALFAGVGMGSSAQPEPRTETKIETKTVTKEVTPQACLTALENGESVMMLAGEAMGVMSKGFDYASEFDLAGLQSVSSELDSMQPSIVSARSAWDSSVAECKGN